MLYNINDTILNASLSSLPPNPFIINRGGAYNIFEKIFEYLLFSCWYLITSLDKEYSSILNVTVGPLGFLRNLT
jgi:hypothetical protein